jgi:hypothetical protein
LRSSACAREQHKKVKEATQKNPPAMTPIDVPCVKVTAIAVALDEVEVREVVPVQENNIRR